MQKCLNCGELAKKGESLCLECRWDRRQLREESGLSAREKVGPNPIIKSDLPQLNHEKKSADLGEAENSSASSHPQQQIKSFDKETLPLLEELIELQKIQNSYSQRMASSLGIIVAFLLLALFGTVIWWFALRDNLPEA